MYDVAATLHDKLIGLWDAAFAGLAAIALSCRYAGQSLKGKPPKGFPLDPFARLERYVRAYSDLVSASGKQSLPSVNSMRPLSASEQAQKMFSNTNIVVHNEKKPKGSQQGKKG